MTLREQVDALMTQRITAEGGWDDQINAFTEFVYMQLEEQRQLCADKAEEVIACLGVKEWHQLVRDACFNAVEKK